MDEEQHDTVKLTPEQMALVRQAQISQKNRLGHTLVEAREAAHKRTSAWMKTKPEKTA